MAEERIFFPSEGLTLEGLIHTTDSRKAVVVTHPHPLYGGDMHNHVVETITSAYQQEGYTTLRFNFRGTGRSEGTYGQGVEEQKDIRAALAYLTTLGNSRIDLAGYSFGSWVSAMGIETYDQASRVIFISPPVDFMDFSSLGYSPKIQLVITASEDTYATPQKIKEMLTIWNPQAELKVIQGTDHFYGSGTADLAAAIGNFLDRTSNESV